jgi:hypothetical protein
MEAEESNDKLVPKVMNLLKPNRKKEGVSSAEEEEMRIDPRKVREKQEKFSNSMKLVDEEIRKMDSKNPDIQKRTVFSRSKGGSQSPQ